MNNFSLRRHEGHEVPQREYSTEQDFSKENPISKQIVDCAFRVHKKIGPGLLESAYQECMVKEFQKRNITFNYEHFLPIRYDGEVLATRYRVDFLVENSIIVELKSVERILPVHEAQTLTYLKLSDFRMALLINFSSPLIKDGVKRYVI